MTVVNMSDHSGLKELERLIKSFCAGDSSCFDQIQTHYRSKLWRFLCARANNHQDAEDLFSIVSLAVAHSLPSLKDPSRLSSWVLSIAVNRISDFYRKKEPTPVDIDDLYEAFEDPEQIPEARLQERSRFTQIRLCIRKLPEPKRTWFEQQFLAETPQADIAREHGVNLNNLKATIARSKLKVADCLRRSGVLPK